jgi:peptidoglycan/xylan/chitin deacetylase (PgdA/CDA1 family)
MVAENHEIGNHLLRMEASIRLSPEEFERQLVESHKVLSHFSPIRWFRPGSGWYNDHMLKTLNKHGYQCVLGSVYPFDPQIRWSWFSTHYILGNAFPGSIIVLHDGGTFGKRTINTLSIVLPELKQRGFRILTLSNLMSLRSACITPAGVMRSNG